MSLVAKVEEMVAELGDGLLHAVKHLAGEVEKIASGGVDEEKVAELLRDKLQAELTGSLQELKDVVGSRVQALEKDAQDLRAMIEGLQANLHSPAAPPADPAAPAEQTAGSSQAAPQPQVPAASQEQAPQQAS